MYTKAVRLRTLKNTTVYLHTLQNHGSRCAESVLPCRVYVYRIMYCVARNLYYPVGFMYTESCIVLLGICTTLQGIMYTESCIVLLGICTALQGTTYTESCIVLFVICTVLLRCYAVYRILHKR